MQDACERFDRPVWGYPVSVAGAVILFEYLYVLCQKAVFPGMRSYESKPRARSLFPGKIPRVLRVSYRSAGDHMLCRPVTRCPVAVPVGCRAHSCRIHGDWRYILLLCAAPGIHAVDVTDIFRERNRMQRHDPLFCQGSLNRLLSFVDGCDCQHG